MSRPDRSQLKYFTVTRMDNNYRLIYRQHAVKRMHERGIAEDEVEHAIISGEVIHNYPNDTPYPSTLLLGQAGTKAIHVVKRETGDRPRFSLIPIDYHIELHATKKGG